MRQSDAFSFFDPHLAATYTQLIDATQGNKHRMERVNQDIKTLEALFSHCLLGDGISCPVYLFATEDNGIHEDVILGHLMWDPGLRRIMWKPEHATPLCGTTPLRDATWNVRLACYDALGVLLDTARLIEHTALADENGSATQLWETRGEEARAQLWKTYGHLENGRRRNPPYAPPPPVRNPPPYAPPPPVRNPPPYAPPPRRGVATTSAEAPVAQKSLE